MLDESCGLCSVDQAHEVFQRNRGALVLVQTAKQAAPGVLIRVGQSCIVMSQCEHNFASFHVVIVVFDYWNALFEHLYAFFVAFPGNFVWNLAQN